MNSECYLFVIVPREWGSVQKQGCCQSLQLGPGQPLISEPSPCSELKAGFQPTADLYSAVIHLGHPEYGVRFSNVFPACVLVQKPKKFCRCPNPPPQSTTYISTLNVHQPRTQPSMAPDIMGNAKTIYSKKKEKTRVSTTFTSQTCVS